MNKVLVIHGPNLNLLGDREPEVYGRITLEGINTALDKLSQQLGMHLLSFQSNHEGEIVEAIGKARKEFQAIVINPAAYTHTSVAIRDAITASGLPAVEVHLSNVYRREDFRHKSLIAPVCRGQIAGFGVESYLLALRAVEGILKNA